MSKKSVRLDYLRVDSSLMLPNGFLKAEAYLTRCGVFEYFDDAGNVIRELRHPDDVLNPMSLNTICGLVVTNDHPPEFLNSENCKQYAVGFTSDMYEIDDLKVGSVLTLTEKDCIQQVTSGEKTDMSCGYVCDILDESGEWLGQPYDKRQINISYNHVSVVKDGRAGKEVGIKMDSKSERIDFKYSIFKNDSCNEKNGCLQFKKDLQKETQKMSVKIKIDSAEVDVTQQVADAYNSLQSAKSSLEGEKATLQSEIVKKDSKTEELEKQLSDDAVLVRADSLLKIKEFSQKVLGDEKLDGVSIADMKSKVVAKQTGLDVSKKDSAFIDASFETIKSLWKDEPKKDEMKEVLAEAVKKDSVLNEYEKKRDSRWKEMLK